MLLKAAAVLPFCGPITARTVSWWMVRESCSSECWMKVIQAPLPLRERRPSAAWSTCGLAAGALTRDPDSRLSRLDGSGLRLTANLKARQNHPNPDRPAGLHRQGRV